MLEHNNLKLLYSVIVSVLLLLFIYTYIVFIVYNMYLWMYLNTIHVFSIEDLKNLFSNKYLDTLQPCI